MAFSMIASKKAALVAALMIRKVAFNDARVLQAASVQSSRSLNTNSREITDPREVEALDDVSKLGWAPYRMSRDIDDPNYSRAYSDRTKYFIASAGEPLSFPLSNRIGLYENEDENRLEMRMDMPGLGKEHVKLISKQNTLIIKGEGEEEIGEEQGSKSYHYRIDFVYGYKLNEIEAEMKNGILKIVAPKG